MKKDLSLVFGSLMLLTLTTFIIFNLSINQYTKTISILGLFVVKFLLVAFQFMELKKANVIWKVAVISILALINVIIIISLKE
jgi:hypothetical protein